MDERRPVQSDEAVAVASASDTRPVGPNANEPGAPNDHVAIIGSGVGALSAAIKCRAAGMSVSVFEKNKHLGGKLGAIRVKGRAIDSGPTVFTLKPLFDELFESAGLSFDDFATTEKLDTLAYHIWPDDSDVTLYADVGKSAEAIRAFGGDSAMRAYRSFAHSSLKAFETLDQRFMRQKGPSMLALFKGLNLSGLLAGSPFTTLWKKLDSIFDDKRLTQLFARYSTYCGSSPFLAPATLMLVAHAEQRGVWAIKGGMAGLAQALVQAGSKLGVTYHTGSNVAELDIEDNRVQAIHLASGKQIKVGRVIFGGDICALTGGLLGGAGRAAGGTLPVDDRSLSAITFQLTAKLSGRALQHHTVVFGSDYRDEFDAIFDRGEITPDPTIYLCCPDRGPFQEPNEDGDERIFMLINAPATGDRHSYTSEEKRAWFNRVTDRLARHDIRMEPTSEPVITSPTEFSTLFPATGGALYGRANHGPFASFKRSPVKSKVKGLYLAGGSVHPSPGVPMASLSGQMAADCLISDWISAKK